jgi:hypothetical protein
MKRRPTAQSCLPSHLALEQVATFLVEEENFGRKLPKEVGSHARAAYGDVLDSAVAFEVTWKRGWARLFCIIR